MRCILKSILIALTLISGLTANAFTSNQDQHPLLEQLQLWDKRNLAIDELKATVKTLDVMSEPENDERYWWNPFWRANRKRQLQQLNELMLTIQHLDIEQQAHQPKLKLQVLHYIENCLNSTSLSSEAHQLWQQADAWRFNQVLNQVDLDTLKQQLLAAENQELYANRLNQLEAFISEAKQLLTYIEHRLTQVKGKPKEFYQHWSQILTKKIGQAIIPVKKE